MIRRLFAALLTAALGVAPAVAESQEPTPPSAAVPPPELVRMSKGLPPKKTSLLTESKYYLAYRPMTASVSTTVELQLVFDNLAVYQEMADKMLDPAADFQTAGPNNFLLLGCVIYANGDNPDRTSPKYAVGMLSGGCFDAAAAVSREILKKDENNYGATLILGLLSMRDRELFPYFEKAFRKSPVRTIMLVGELGSAPTFCIPPDKQWDFIDAYVKLLVADREAILKADLGIMQLIYLERMLMEKYFDPETDDILPGFEDRADELRDLRDGLRRRNEEISRSPRPSGKKPVSGGSVKTNSVRPHCQVYSITYIR